jgi:hypothetical protein
MAGGVQVLTVDQVRVAARDQDCIVAGRKRSFARAIITQHYFYLLCS